MEQNRAGVTWVWRVNAGGVYCMSKQKSQYFHTH